MSVYVITGKLGSGKSLSVIYRIFEGLNQGKRIATNLDLYPENICKPNVREIEVTRLPDKPRVIDLEALGTGDNKPIDEYNEDGFGLLVLDELASWLNSPSVER